MSKITITVELDSNESGTKKTLDFLDSLSEFLSEGVERSSKSPVNVSKKETVKTQKPKKEILKKEIPAKEAEEENNVDTSDEKPTITEIRTSVSKKVKVGDNRTKVKSKLKDLGASSVTTLSEDKYSEFYEFLQELD